MLPLLWRSSIGVSAVTARDFHIRARVGRSPMARQKPASFFALQETEERKASKKLLAGG